MGLMVEEHVLNSNYDAIIGLAYPSMADAGLPLVDMMMQQTLLAKNVFAFFMSVNDEEQSELMFGGYDPHRFQGPLIWHPVRYPLFWAIQLDDIKYNN